MGERQIWAVAKPDYIITEKLRRELGVSRLMAQFLANRGFTRADSAARFLEADIACMEEPCSIPQVLESAARIRRALLNGEKILVYGDYDVDGITACALLTDLLRKLGGEVTYYIPDRLEGYGLNTNSILAARNRGVSLLITVDCGISSLQEVDYAVSLGLDVIITDHHQPGEELPRAFALVNPKLAAGDPPWNSWRVWGLHIK